MPHIRRSLNTQPLGGKDNMGGTVSVGTDYESPHSCMAVVSVEHIKHLLIHVSKPRVPSVTSRLLHGSAPWLQEGKAQLGSVNHNSVGQASGCAAQA